MVCAVLFDNQAPAILKSGVMEGFLYDDVDEGSTLIAVVIRRPGRLQVAYTGIEESTIIIKVKKLSEEACFFSRGEEG